MIKRICKGSAGVKVGYDPELDHDEFPVVIMPRSCNCWFCSKCARKKGRKLREKVKTVVKQFDGMLMLTFTLDQTHFKENIGSAGESYDYIRQKRCIAEFMRALKRKGAIKQNARWLYVLEMHKSGWPHFHMLVEADFIPHAMMYSIWNKLGPLGRMGSVNFSKKKFENREHAANYITKYVIKDPENGIPPWVLIRANVRRYQHSRGMIGFTRKPRYDDPDRKKREKKKAGTVAERRLKCGADSTLIAQHFAPDGRLESKFRYSIPFPLSQVKEFFGIDPEEKGNVRLTRESAAEFIVFYDLAGRGTRRPPLTCNSDNLSGNHDRKPPP